MSNLRDHNINMRASSAPSPAHHSNNSSRGNGRAPRDMYDVEPSSHIINALMKQAGDQYEDFSQVKENDIPISIHAQRKLRTLHEILANEEHNDAITWLPHGRAWAIRDMPYLESNVFPKFFRHEHGPSFRRLVSQWGFTRIASGPDEGAYYHEKFLRGLPHVSDMMMMLPKTPRNTKHFLGSKLQGVHPDFYAMSPLPLPGQTVATSSSPANVASANASSSNNNSMVGSPPSKLSSMQYGSTIRAVAACKSSNINGAKSRINARSNNVSTNSANEMSDSPLAPSPAAFAKHGLASNNIAASAEYIEYSNRVFGHVRNAARCAVYGEDTVPIDPPSKTEIDIAMKEANTAPNKDDTNVPLEKKVIVPNNHPVKTNLNIPAAFSKSATSKQAASIKTQVTSNPPPSQENEQIIAEDIEMKHPALKATTVSSSVNNLKQGANMAQIKAPQLKKEAQAQQKQETEQGKGLKNVQQEKAEMAISKTCLINFYRNHNPEKNDNVDIILKDYHGHEHDLNQKLKNKYGEGILPFQVKMQSAKNEKIKNDKPPAEICNAAPLNGIQSDQAKENANNPPSAGVVNAGPHPNAVVPMMPMPHPFTGFQGQPFPPACIPPVASAMFPPMIPVPCMQMAPPFFQPMYMHVAPPGWLPAAPNGPPAAQPMAPPMFQPMYLPVAPPGWLPAAPNGPSTAQPMAPSMFQPMYLHVAPPGWLPLGPMDGPPMHHENPNENVDGNEGYEDDGHENEEYEEESMVPQVGDFDEGGQESITLHIIPHDAEEYESKNDKNYHKW